MCHIPERMVLVPALWSELFERSCEFESVTVFSYCSLTINYLNRYCICEVDGTGSRHGEIRNA
jgi:hypothetical protein